MPVVDRLLAEPHPRMLHFEAAPPDDRDQDRADVSSGVEAGPGARHRVDGGFDPDHGLSRGDDEMRGARIEPDRRQRQAVQSLGVELRRAIAFRKPMVETSERRCRDLGEALTNRDRHQLLMPDALATSLDAALVVACARPREAGLEQVVRHQRREALRQLAHRATQQAAHGRLQVVEGDAERNEAEVLEGTHESVEEAHLILTVVEPTEVAARET
jgi:hypothetical protein